VCAKITDTSGKCSWECKIKNRRGKCGAVNFSFSISFSCGYPFLLRYRCFAQSLTGASIPIRQLFNSKSLLSKIKRNLFVVFALFQSAALF
jgi:hypothetical protein